MDRRKFIKASVAGTIPLASGCLSEDEEKESETNSIYNSPNPILTNIEKQPYIGARDSTKAIIAVEDPSCPYCARFHNRTFPDIKNEAESGNLKYYTITVPFIQPWSQKSLHYLEGCYNEYGSSEFFELLGFYYENQDNIDSNNIENNSEEYILNNIGNQSFIDKIENGDYSQDVRDDYNAVREAGISSTPTFLLFENGRYITTIQGAQRFNIFKNTLQL